MGTSVNAVGSETGPLDAATPTGDEPSASTQIAPSAESLAAPSSDDEATDTESTPRYLLITHTLDLDGTSYTCSEVVNLSESDLASGSYGLDRHVMEKEGMAPLHIYCADEEAGLVEKATVSAADFTQAGDPQDGSAYLALQVVIEYRMLDGYRAVLSSGANQGDDPYGIMPMTSFEGSNIKDITFVPADVITVRLNYKYSSTGGLAGIDAAPTQVYQIHIPDVERDENGTVTSAGELNATYPVPHFDPSDPSTSALKGFRIVLDPTPLNAYVNNPVLAQQAMEGKLSAEQIQEALNNDAFVVSTSNPSMPVYEWQAQGKQPPSSYDDYTQNTTYGNRYSDQYNAAWVSARSSSNLSSSYYARIDSSPAVDKQGANPLDNPMLTFSLSEEQCVAALNSTDSEVTVNVYYRRNAGFYNVAHWVPHANIPASEIATYKSQYPEYNEDDGAYHRDGLIMVYLERKQGRVGALTNARPYPAEKESLLRSFVPQPFVQEEVATDTTRVDITYDVADSYSLIFLTDGSYIPRQQVDAGDTVAFSATPDAKMSITKADGTTSTALDYRNPTRQGYEFAGWKYEVKAIPDGAVERDGDGKLYRPGESGYYTQENGKLYKSVLLTDATADNAWVLSGEVLANTVAVQDSNGDNSKIIYLSPIWTPNEANVRVVFWTEDLGGTSKDAKVTLSDSSESFPYCQNLPKEYLGGTPETVGANFSNVGSFTFMAPTGAKLDLSVSDGTLGSTTAGTFKATGETGSNADPKNLTTLINDMFAARMPSETVSTGEAIDTASFYHAYQVDGATQATYAVAADGSTVINVYFARNVYTLNFTYYGTTTAGNGGGTGITHGGEPGLAVATNTIGYTLGGGTQGYDYQYVDNSTKLNRWERVADGSENAWTVPRTITIQAKYNADLRDTWPCTNNEAIPVTLQAGDDKGGTTAYFVSWAATAGPFSKAYREAYADGRNGESTIMGAYCAMSADIIADPTAPATSHNLYAYWWNQTLSYYRFNTCHEIPGLTWSTLEADTSKKAVNLRTGAPEPALNFDLKGVADDLRVGNNPLYIYNSQSYDGQTNFDNHISAEEAERRDTIYLVPATGALSAYFDDYRDDLLHYDEHGVESDAGTYYAVRRIDTTGDSKIYAIARHVMASSSNYIAAQAPSAETHMTLQTIKYTSTWGDQSDENTISVDHSSRVWDDWGRTVTSIDPNDRKGLVQVGSPDNPYDLYYYYNRDRFDIHYMVPAKDSVSGEYEYGTRQMIYGESLAKYRVNLSSNDKGKYSDDASYPWTAVDNATTPGSLRLNDAALNIVGHAAMVPDSAQGSRGTWGFEGWCLDRAGKVSAESAWNARVTGNLRVFALWEPPQYQVKFDFDGGSYNGSSSFPIQKVAANVGYTSSGNPIPSPTKPGYDFAGWTWHESTSTSGEPTAGTEIDFNFEKPITQDLVLTANWVSNAKQTYRYKIWCLTDDPDAMQAEKPADATGTWLEGTDRGTPHPDANHSAFTHILGCQYFDDQELPDNTTLSLVAESIPGYLPAHVSTTLLLRNETGTNAATTENVAYFYYRKSPVKTYRIRYQLYDKTGEDGIVKHLTTDSSIADDVFFSPTNRAWLTLKAAGYQLVQMDEDGNTKWSDGQPIPAQNYLELEDFINARNREFADMNRGEEATITFKVAPIPYSISYQVGTLAGGEGMSAEEGEALRTVMQEALDGLAGDDLRGAATAKSNPTRYKVTDFDGGYSVTLVNPISVQNPANPDEVWEFVGWSPGPGTTSGSRSADENYPELELEESVGDLVFLANWKKVGADEPEGPASGDQDDIVGGSEADGTDTDDSDDGGALAATRDAIAKGLVTATVIALCALAVLALLRATGRLRRGAHAVSRRAKAGDRRQTR